MRKQPDRRLVRMSIPIYQRLHEIVAQLRKDGRILFLHTIDKEIRPSVEGLVDYAVEWFADCYTPLESTPGARIEEYQDLRHCPKCGHDWPGKKRPHLDWGPLAEWKHIRQRKKK